MKLSRAQRARLRQIVRGRSDEALFVLEGPKAIREALDAGVVAELWIRRDLNASLAADLRDAAHVQDVPVGDGAPADFAQVADTVSAQGVFALVRDPAQDVDAVLRAPSAWVLWLDGVQDPGNTGALVRVAAGLGAGVLVSRGGAHPMGVKALRASAGLALRTPFAVDDAERIAAACTEGPRAAWLLEAGGDDVFEVDDLPAANVLAIGSEGRGVSDAARAMTTRAVGISMAGGVESLNVAVATGIALAVLTRRGARA